LSLQQMPNLCKYLVGGDELGCPGIDLGDAATNFVIPGRLNLFIRLLHCGEEFFGQANALFRRQ